MGVARSVGLEGSVLGKGECLMHGGMSGWRASKHRGCEYPEVITVGGRAADVTHLTSHKCLPRNHLKTTDGARIT